MNNGPREVFSTLIHPGCSIPPEASAVHHITDRDVADKPALEAVWPQVLELVEGAVLVAHNAEFDRSMLPETGRPWLCSKRFAQHLWPDAPNFQNQTLRYWLGIDIDVGLPHRAMGDAVVTAHVFQRELAAYLARGYEDDPAALFNFVAGPVEVRTMPFGKHRGQLLEEVPRDYLNWVLENVQRLDADLEWSIRRVLGKSA
ncbi:putative quorum-sensing-regulated virulence factor [Alicyclobacillus macrosporangiidus]|uniref:Exodeoxyribonuclease X n=1 Tax=Alicyclobacillus macrosporangiidus TaxID=392015 RepID=A0A1I7J976_9BACL|nr:DUF3820 family protein [Alicyclobacillus macrosporangiidus]SFU81749.1 exodeoxyribonuclease X [Alicyclobacillus macrosporangiidus]